MDRYELYLNLGYPSFVSHHDFVIISFANLILNTKTFQILGSSTFFLNFFLFNSYNPQLEGFINSHECINQCGEFGFKIIKREDLI